MSKSGSLRWRIAQWLEIRWWQRYLGKKNKINYYAQKALYWQRTLNAIDLQLPEKQKILDIGCGPAGIFIILKGHQVKAIDPLLNQYAEQLPYFSPKEYPWVDFESVALEKVQGEPSPWLFCFNAINHISDWNRGLDQISTLTSAGGTLVLGTDVHKYTWLKTIFRWLPGDLLHPQQHLAIEYREALLQRGWCIKKVAILKKGFIFDYWIVKAQKSTDT